MNLLTLSNIVINFLLKKEKENLALFELFLCNKFFFLAKKNAIFYSFFKPVFDIAEQQQKC